MRIFAFFLYIFIVSLGFALQADAKDLDVSINTGGYFRWSEEWFHRPNFGQGVDQSQGYFLQRYLAHLEIKDSSQDIRWYFQGKYSEITNKFGPLSSVDRDYGDAHQAFFENKNVRVGRQEVILGSSLLIGVREGPNSRLSFDGAKVFSKTGPQWEFFIGHPVDIEADLLDNHSGTALVSFVHLIGLKKTEQTQGDLYLVYFEDDVRLFTLGTRWLFQNPGFSWDTDVVLQGGSAQDKDVQAYGFASRLKVPVGTVDFTMLVSLFSGDKDSEDDKFNTFDALFPKGQYYSWSAEIGHPNLMALEPGFIWHLQPTLHWASTLGFFWRENIHDGIYRGNDMPFRAPTNEERFIATHINSSGEWNITKIWSFYFEYTYALAGDFIRDSEDAQDSQYFALRTAARF